MESPRLASFSGITNMMRDQVMSSFPAGVNLLPSCYQIASWSGQKIIVYGSSGQVEIYTDTGEFLQTLPGLTGFEDEPVQAVALCSNTGLLATSNQQLLSIYAPLEENCLNWNQILIFQCKGVSCLAWTSSGKLVAAGDGFNLLDVKNNKNTGSFLSLAWSKSLPVPVARISISSVDNVCSIGLFTRLSHVWTADNESGFNYTYLQHPRSLVYTSWIDSNCVLTLSHDGFCRVWSKIIDKQNGEIYNISSQILLENEIKRNTLLKLERIDLLSASYTSVNEISDTLAHKRLVERFGKLYGIFSLSLKCGTIGIWGLIESTTSTGGVESTRIKFTWIGTTNPFEKAEIKRVLSPSTAQSYLSSENGIPCLFRLSHYADGTLRYFKSLVLDQAELMKAKFLKEWNGHYTDIMQVRFSSGILGTLSKNGSLKFWMLATLPPHQEEAEEVVENGVEKKEWRILARQENVQSFAFLSIANWTIVLFKDGTVRLFEMRLQQFSDCQVKMNNLVYGQVNVFFPPQRSRLYLSFVIFYTEEGPRLTKALQGLGRTLHFEGCSCKGRPEFGALTPINESLWEMAQKFKICRFGIGVAVMAKERNLQLWSFSPAFQKFIQDRTVELEQEVLDCGLTIGLGGGSNKVVAVLTETQVFVVGAVRSAELSWKTNWHVITSIPVSQSSTCCVQGNQLFLAYGNRLGRVELESFVPLGSSHSVIEMVQLNNQDLPIYHPLALEMLSRIGKWERLGRIFSLLQVSIEEKRLPDYAFIKDNHPHQAYNFTLSDTIDIRIDEEGDITFPLISESEKISGLCKEGIFKFKNMLSFYKEAYAHKEQLDQLARLFLLEKWTSNNFGTEVGRSRAVCMAMLSKTKDGLIKVLRGTGGGVGGISLQEFKKYQMGFWLGGENDAQISELALQMARLLFLQRKDPLDCFLLYACLRKKAVLLGLWRTAVGHGEQGKMVMFLSKDLKEPRWKEACIKNAYSLLGKQRYELAASFFLLGESLADAVKVCLQHLKDLQLALLMVKLFDPSALSALLEAQVEITNSCYLKFALKWMLNQREEALSALVENPEDPDPTIGWLYRYVQNNFQLKTQEQLPPLYKTLMQLAFKKSGIGFIYQEFEEDLF